jgi:multisubunit Na+/H+ antiporter MnhE subunit
MTQLDQIHWLIYLTFSFLLFNISFTGFIVGTCMGFIIFYFTQRRDNPRRRG